MLHTTWKLDFLHSDCNILKSFYWDDSTMTSPVLLAGISSQRRRKKKKPCSFLHVEKSSYLSHKRPWYLSHCLRILRVANNWFCFHFGTSTASSNFISTIRCLAFTTWLIYCSPVDERYQSFSEVYFKFTWHSGGTQSWPHVGFLARHTIIPTKILRKNLLSNTYVRLPNRFFGVLKILVLRVLLSDKEAQGLSCQLLHILWHFVWHTLETKLSLQAQQSWRVG